jgi:transcription termination factor Rho
MHCKERSISLLHEMWKMEVQLSIIATALTETGSKMDEVILKSLRNGNMGWWIENCQQTYFPAIDLTSSSTRRDDCY